MTLLHLKVGVVSAQFVQGRTGDVDTTAKEKHNKGIQTSVNSLGVGL